MNVFVTVKNTSSSVVSFYNYTLRPGQSCTIRPHLLRMPKIKQLMKTRKLIVKDDVKIEDRVLSPRKIDVVKPEEINYKDVTFFEEEEVVDLSEAEALPTIDLTTSKPVRASEDLAKREQGYFYEKDDLVLLTKLELQKICKKLYLDDKGKKKEDLIEQILRSQQ